jgi:hypothetical protein
MDHRAEEGGGVDLFSLAFTLLVWFVASPLHLTRRILVVLFPFWGTGVDISSKKDVDSTCTVYGD